MNPKTLKALRESIAHWKRMATGKAKPDEAPSGKCCALCQMYALANNSKCDGCPVMEHTGHENCRGTPYHEARGLWEVGSLRSPDFMHAATKELEFLESLLPKRRKKP